MSWQYKVGQRVVCIDDLSEGWFQSGDCIIPTRYPMMNEVLTISSMSWENHSHGEGLFLSFEEIDLRQRDGGFSADVMYRATSFRPLDERKTDISIFTAMLDHTPKELIPASYTMPNRAFE